MTVATVGLMAGLLLGGAAVPALATAATTTAATAASAAATASASAEVRHGATLRADEQQTVRGELAKAGSDSDTMLYAGLAISLCVLGALAVAAARSRRN
ncbi:hypothetical protein ABZ916_30150 [Streptomyces sp. NPDC046853]|uniref:hypothetical protein n=1 Tax=Streptomyces sp. NPDC046853 TaxID=3154920 RepID=UPI0033F902EC